MSFKPKYLLLLAPFLMAACSSVPTGPTVNVMPGKNASFEQFKADDQECRDFAQDRAGEPSDAETKTVLKNAGVATIVGAVAGAALDHGHGHGAAVGAGSGLILGTLGGAAASGQAQRAAQAQYDNAYTQCMYAKGHDVPVSGSYRNQVSNGQGSSYGPPPKTTTPPPDDYVVKDNAPVTNTGKTPSNGDYVVQEN